jgi:long-chain acyl-CoA synthetase
VAVSFWALEQVAGDRAALIDAASGATISYAGLLDRVASAESILRRFGQRTLGLIFAENTVESIAVYLASLRAGHPAVLMDRALSPELIGRVVETYRPRWIFCSGTALELEGYDARQGAALMLERRDTRDIPLHPDLALMLSTSGSTGSPKLVRLGHRNVASNAQSIAEYLGLSAAERPITSLPMAYSYGLSIINSHLAVGATLVLTNRGVLEKDFWSAMAEYECTSFAGVPYTYQMLLRVGLLKKPLPSLRTLTQAGGRLDPSYIEQVRTIASERGWSFYVMYGQTEASPRISYVPPAELHRKVGSIGIPVPGGSLEVDPDGELVYSGPNVMLGYAQCEADLCKGDELGGVLKTGDLGRRDEDGFFYVTGRRSRFLKMFGQRFSLDEIENELASRLHSPVACRGSDDHLSVFVEGTAEQASAARALVSELFALHHSAFEVHALAAIPVHPSGKTNYQALAELVRR